MAIHALCLAAGLVRTIYIICEAVLVYNASSQSLEKVVGGSAAFVGLHTQAGVLYTAFFSLSAAAFLCTCRIQRDLYI